MNIPNFDEILTKYGDLMVKVGLNLQPDQRLIVIATSLEVAPLIRKITESAYKNGAPLVSVLWSDEQTTKARMQYAPKDSFEEFAGWTLDGVLQSMERGDAFLQISGRNPHLLKGQDPESLAIAAKTFSQHRKAIGDHQGKRTVQWSMACPPTQDWAAAVFPDATPEDALTKLWEAVIKACRLDLDDPIAFWHEQAVNLGKRKHYLTDKKYTELKFNGPGTDLTVGLPKGHIWEGGSGKSKKDVTYSPNIPTEEVFTMPHRERINGKVSSTKPLNYLGNLIDNFSFTFSEGKIVEFLAEKGEAVLDGLLETDPNARFLGEVALVPHQTPISQQELVFLNTLYDENASHHLALGNAYKYSLEGGTKMSEEEFLRAGGNNSLVHVDFMFGSGDVDVDGVLADGTVEPIMRAGEWTFEV